MQKRVSMIPVVISLDGVLKRETAVVEWTTVIHARAIMQLWGGQDVTSITSDSMEGWDSGRIARLVSEARKKAASFSSETRSDRGIATVALGRISEIPVVRTVGPHAGNEVHILGKCDDALWSALKTARGTKRSRLLTLLAPLLETSSNETALYHSGWPPKRSRAALASFERTANGEEPDQLSMLLIEPERPAIKLSAAA